jgi:hypothetical protein
VISTQISRVSAVVLLASGLALLFGSDVILPLLVPSFPVSAAWIGQLLAAALLALAALNWLSGAAMLGGIYGRPVVMANVTFYFVAAMVVLDVARHGDAAATVWIVAAPVVILAAIYGWLLFRGPFERDFEKSRARNSTAK